MGTKKRRNYYRRKVPPELTGLGSSNKVRLYRVNLLLEEALADDLNRKGRRLYYPERQPTKLGLVLGAGATLPDDCLRFEGLCFTFNFVCKQNQFKSSGLSTFTSTPGG